mgnify:CR=1 FL=1
MAIALVAVHLDPRRRNLEQSRAALSFILGSLALVLLAVHGATIAGALGYDLDVARVVIGAVGLLFAVIGNFLTKARSNFAVGIRTPWTLSSDEVWRQTHRVGGMAFTATGCLTLLAAILLPLGWAIALLSVGAAITVLISFAYSWWLYRRETGG